MAAINIAKPVRNVLLVDVPQIPFVESNPVYAAVNRQKAEFERLTYSPAYAKHLSGRQYGYGLLSIGSHIKDLGIKINYTDLDVINGHKEPAQFNAADIAFIGLNICVAEPTSIALARMIKAWNPGCVVVVGGHHATYRFKFLLEKIPEIDIVVKGEGEAPVRNLITQPEMIYYLEGLAFRSSNGKSIIDNGLAPRLPGHYIPRPDYGLLNRPFDEYGLRMVTTRGCGKPSPENGTNGSCSFCSEKRFFGKVRSKSNESIAAELEDIQGRLKKTRTNSEEFTHIHIADPNIAWDEDRLVEMSTAMEKFSSAFEFSANLYATSVNPRILKALKKANFVRLYVGLEDPSPEILVHMKKGIQFESVIGALTLIKEFGFHPGAYTIYGLPGSTPTTLQKHTEEIAGLIERGLADEIFSAMYTPVPGTDIYNHPKKYGIEITDQDWSHYHRDGGPVFRLKDVDSDQLRKGYHEFKKAIISAYSKHPLIKKRV